MVHTKELVQRLALCVLPQLAAELRGALSGDDKEDCSTYQLLVIATTNARREDGVKRQVFRQWKARAAAERRLSRLLERGQQLSDDRRMRAALQQWTDVAFESRCAAVLLSRGLALCAVLLASARQAASSADSTASTTRTLSFASSVLTYGAALHHAQRRALEVTFGRQVGKPTLPPVPGLGPAREADASDGEHNSLRVQLEAALVTVRERDARLRELQVELSAASELSRQTTQHMQRQSADVDYWRGEASRWREAHDTAQRQLSESQALVQDSVAVLERLQTEQHVHTQQLARAQAEREHLTQQLRAAGEESREVAAQIAQLTAERDALHDSVIADRAAAEMQLRMSELSRTQAEEACHALRAALEGAEGRLSAMLVSASSENAELAAQLCEAEARAAAAEERLGYMESHAAVSATPGGFDIQQTIPPMMATPASPLVRSRVLDRMAAVRQQLNQHDELQQYSNLCVSTPAASQILHSTVLVSQSSSTDVHVELRGAAPPATPEEDTNDRFTATDGATELSLHGALQHISLLMMQIEELREQMGDVQRARDDAAADVIRVTGELARARMEVRVAKAGNTAQKTQVVQHVSGSVMEEDREEVNTLRRSLDAADAQNIGLRGEIDRMHSERTELDGELAHWSAQVERATHGYNARIADLMSQVKALEQQVHECNVSLAAQRIVANAVLSCTLSATKSAAHVQAEQLRKQLDQQTAAAAASRAASEKLLAEVQAQADAARVDAQERAQEFAALRSQMEQKAAEAAALEHSLADARAEMDAARAEEQARVKEMAALKSLLKHQSGAATAARAELEQLLAEARALADAARSDVQTRVQELAALRAQLDKQAADSAADRSAWERAVAEAHAHADRVRAEEQERAQEVAALREQLEKLAADAARAHATLQKSHAEALAKADGAHADELGRQLAAFRASASAHKAAALADLQARMQARTLELINEMQARHDAQQKRAARASNDTERPAMVDAVPVMALAPGEGIHPEVAPQSSREGILWVRHHAAGANAAGNHGPPQWTWIRHRAVLWSNGVLKLKLEASPYASQTDQENVAVVEDSTENQPSEVDLAACDAVVMAAMDSYRQTSLRRGKQSCFHVLRPGGSLAIAAACGNDAETRDWADMLRLFVAPRVA